MKNDPVKESAKLIVAYLLEADERKGYFEYRVYPDEEGWCDSLHAELCFNIQVPTEMGVYVNKVNVPKPLDEKGIAQVEQRMSQLAAQRKYPPGSFFVTPWGEYLIHGGTIGKI